MNPTKKSKPFLILFIFFTLFNCKSSLENRDEYVLRDNVSIKTLSRPQPDQRGIISYANYQIFIANGNETVEEVAIRLKIIPKELALYNGLIINYRPRDGEVLALPKRINSSEIKIFKDWSEESTRETIKTEVGIEVEKLSNPNDPLRHRVISGETAYSIANLYNVSVTSLANWNGLGPDLTLRVGREIIIPAAATSDDYYQRAQEKDDQNKIKIVKNEQNDISSALENKDENKTIDINKKQNEIEINNNNESVTNNLKKDILNQNNQKSKESKFVIPVIGIIKNDYNPNPEIDEKRNNGIDYEVKGESIIKATADGVVVLISEKAVGSEGKILLMKHKNELISIYGGIGELLVSKGERIKKSSAIGKAVGKKSQKVIVHFEIRKGMKSIDPKELLNDN